MDLINMFVIISVQMIDSLQNMLSAIGQIYKNTQNFNELSQISPLLAELRKSDIENKEIAQYLKLINELLPKLKGKTILSNRGDSIFEVYDRMTNHLTLELNKLNSQFQVGNNKLQEVNNASIRINAESQEQIKTETILIIKEIDEMLAVNKKIVMNYITSKRKQYLPNEDRNHYVNKRLIEKIKNQNLPKSKLQNCKYEFGKFRCLYNMYEVHNRGKQLASDITKLQTGRQTGMSQQMMNRLEKKIELQKRKDFLLKSSIHIEKQYYFVVNNLKKLNQLSNPGKYEEKLFYHYFSWGQRLKILIQTILIKISSFQRNKLNLKEQQSFRQLSRQMQSKYQNLLHELTNALK